MLTPKIPWAARSSTNSMGYSLFSSFSNQYLEPYLSTIALTDFLISSMVSALPPIKRKEEKEKIILFYCLKLDANIFIL
jgi:hypothetical protein